MDKAQLFKSLSRDDKQFHQNTNLTFSPQFIKDQDT